MELSELRNEIDSIDKQIADLFAKRNRMASEVAAYKKEHGLPIFQGAREKEVLEKAASNVPEDMRKGGEILFQTLMDISKCRQRLLLSEAEPFDVSSTAQRPVIGAVTKGSYSAAASEKFCGEDAEIRYFSSFADVFKAVDNGTIDYGALPIENSTAGDVNDTFELMMQHDIYIVKSVKLRIEHVLAAKKGVKLDDIKNVTSHEMALKQCSGFLGGRNFRLVESNSTAKAAENLSLSDSSDTAVICSAYCAKLYGLDIIADDINDIKDNYTRFIMISKKLQVTENANVVSVALTVPHRAGSLYRLLTRFAYSGLNLCRIESRPMPSHLSALKKDAFDFMFYLDFIGSINDENVVKLLRSLETEMRYYRFFGNYEEI